MGRGIYTADMGQPPQEPDDASAAPARRRAPMTGMPTKRPMPKRPMGAAGVFREGMPVPQDIDGASAGRGMKKGGSVGSASKRADGIAKKGKTKGRML